MGRNAVQMNRRTFIGAAGLGAVGTYLAACSVAGATQQSPKSVLHAAFLQSITDLNPLSATSAVEEPALMARRLIFDTLVRPGSVPGSYTPSLATSWSQPNPETWVFKLRDDVKFHDGTRLTASDVAAAVNQARTTTSNLSPLWANVTSAKATDSTTVKVTTDGPLGTMLINMTLLFIPPASAWADTASFSNPVGSGPYKVTSFTPSTNLTLARFPGYWGTPAKNKAIYLPYIAETSTAITSLTTGAVDVIWPVPSDQENQVQGVKGISVKEQLSYVYYFNWFNCGRPPFSDARVRQAMWHAVDIASIVRQLYGTSAEVMTSPIPSTVFGAAPQQPYSYSPTTARQLLAEAGYAKGFTTSLMWFDSTGPLASDLAQAMIAAWANVGVTVAPQAIEEATWLTRLNSLDWDMDLQTNTVTTGDADFTLGRLYTSKADRMGYKNPALDAVLTQAEQSSDQATRKKLYAQACQTIWDDAVGIFPATLKTIYALRDEVSGLVPVPSDQPNLAQVSVS